MIFSLLVYQAVAGSRSEYSFAPIPTPFYSSDFGSKDSESGSNLESCNLMFQSRKNKDETVQVSCSSEFGSCDLAKYIDSPYQYTCWQPPKTQHYQQRVPHTTKKCIQCNPCSLTGREYYDHMRLENCHHGCKRYRDYTTYRNAWRTKAKFENI